MQCPSCGYSLGGYGDAEGSRKFGVKVTLIDEDGRVHGPCRKCGSDVTLATDAIMKAEATPTLPVERELTRRRAGVYLRTDA